MAGFIVRYFSGRKQLRRSGGGCFPRAAQLLPIIERSLAQEPVSSQIAAIDVSLLDRHNLSTMELRELGCGYGLGENEIFPSVVLVKHGKNGTAIPFLFCTIRLLGIKQSQVAILAIRLAIFHLLAALRWLLHRCHNLFTLLLNCQNRLADSSDPFGRPCRDREPRANSAPAGHGRSHFPEQPVQCMGRR